MDGTDDALPFVDGPLPRAFIRWVIELGPGHSHAFTRTEWADTLVVVDRGRLQLDCTAGGRRTFPAGSVLWLAALPLRTLRNPDPTPTVLVAVRRRAGRTHRMPPRILTEAEQPYVAIRRTVTMAAIGDIAHRLPEVAGWLAERELTPDGPPFLRYHLIGTDVDAAGDGPLEVEAGFPIQSAVTGAGEVVAGMLPAGRYATVHHVGPPADLPALTASLLEWATAQGVAWDIAHTGRGPLWACRLQRHLTDPRAEPDPAHWETELAFRLADDPRPAADQSRDDDIARLRGSSHGAATRRRRPWGCVLVPQPGISGPAGPNPAAHGP